MLAKKTSLAFALALLLSVSTLLSMSCETPPKVPESDPRPLVAWPVLNPPPEGIALDESGTMVMVPFDYWIELVGYIRSVDDVRKTLEREGWLVK